MSLQSISFPKAIIDVENNYKLPQPVSFPEILDGPKAFYNQSDYLEATKRDFSQKNRLPVNYTWNTEHKVIRIIKQIFSAIFFPIIIYKLIHALAGKAILPSSNRSRLEYSKNDIHCSRSNISLNGEWKYKRITVEVDGYKIDAAIVGKISTLGNGRWVLASNGNGETYEDKLCYNRDFKEILSEIKGNAIVFNYPGVGASSGRANRQAMTKAYRAILTFLEDKKKGVGTKEFIGYGHSMGGAVQGDALKTHQLKKDVKYVFIKSRTFSDLSTLVSILINKLFGLLIKILGWNISSVESSKKLQAPEIILQSARVKDYKELTDSSKIIYDGVIPAEASLAKALLDDPKCPKKNKIIIGMKEQHNDALIKPSFLAQKIETLLKV